MALLEEFNEINLLPPLRRHLDSGEIKINLEGKLEQNFRFLPEPVWIHTRFSDDRECGMWQKIHFQLYRFIPSPCFDCWKVVAKPRTLKETMAVLDLQKKMDLPSKVGMEKREYSGGLGGWSAFWYSSLKGGLEGGRKLFARVEKAIHEQIDPGVRVYLKRACTEMEMGVGPSDQWVWNENLAMVEDLINKSFAHPPDPGLPPEYIEVDVITRWIYWAAIHGDSTYLEYVDKPLSLVLRSVEYQGSIHNEKDFPLVARKETLAFVPERGGKKRCSCQKEPLICSL